MWQEDDPPDSGVMVMSADHRMVRKKTVQMDCGMVGRSPDCILMAKPNYNVAINFVKLKII
jgi:hypothetical protein